MINLIGIKRNAWRFHLVHSWVNGHCAAIRDEERAGTLLAYRESAFGFLGKPLSYVVARRGFPEFATMTDGRNGALQPWNAIFKLHHGSHRRPSFAMGDCD